jgi:hypothetical protein
MKHAVGSNPSPAATYNLLFCRCYFITDKSYGARPESFDSDRDERPGMVGRHTGFDV